jgi:uncharacterized membrane-anchored protein
MSRFRNAVSAAALILSPLSAASLATLALAPPALAAAPTTQQEAEAMVAALNKQTGTIPIVGGKAEIVVPEGYYFLNADDARKVLVDLWGNPVSSIGDLQGMMFPAAMTPISEGNYGVVVEWNGEGYVADSDAAELQDADAILTELKRGDDPRGHIVGWAEPPKYDPAGHLVHWAKAIQFTGEPGQTLNYDIRVLGRGGFVTLQFIAGMEDWPAVKSAAPHYLAMTHFTEGNRYEDHKMGDSVAGGGLLGLIGIGAVGGAAVAKKAGLLGIIAAFGKKGLVLIGVGIAALFGWVRKLIGGKPAAAEDGADDVNRAA